jgi:hypothetical protein
MIKVSSTTGPADKPLPSLVGTRQHGTVRRRVLIGVALVVALGAGIAIGAAAGSNTSALNAANSQVSSLKGQASALQGQVTTLKGQVSSLNASVTSWKGQAQQATAIAQHATATANAKAAAAYAARNSALNQQAAALKQQQKTVAAEMGQLQANQISGDGVYVVGKDIKSGTWHTNGSGNTGQNDCYFATLNSTDTNNIADNNNFDGAETVDVSGAYAFQVSGPCSWVLVS